MIGDLVVVDVEPLEEGLVEQATLFVVAALVQLLGVFQQGEAHLDQSCALGEVVVGLGEAFGQVLALALDVAELCLDLGFGAGDVVGELPVEEPRGGFLVGDGRADVAADVGDEVGGEPDGGVVGFDGVLDAEDVDGRGWAGAVLFVAAEEVGVLAASGIDGVLDDHSLGDASLLAASVEQ